MLGWIGCMGGWVRPLLLAPVRLKSHPLTGPAPAGFLCDPYFPCGIAYCLDSQLCACASCCAKRAQ